MIGIGEIVDHVFAEAALVIEHVMRDAERLGDARGIADILAGAAGALAPRRGAVIVELQGDADDLAALLDEQRGRDRAVDAARHGDDNAARRRLVEP